jgi:hypothetical protein
MHAERAAHVLIDSEHCRAICDEIGDRLREVLNRDAPKPSSYLLRLLSRLEDQERDALSILPSIEDMQRRKGVRTLEDAI